MDEARLLSTEGPVDSHTSSFGSRRNDSLTEIISELRLLNHNIGQLHAELISMRKHLKQMKSDMYAMQLVTVKETLLNIILIIQ